MVLFHHKAKQETKLIETSNPLFVASSSSLLAQYIMHVAAVFFFPFQMMLVGLMKEAACGYT